MEIFYDCLPCILRQALEASRMATAHPDLQGQIMTKTIELMGNYKAYKNSPAICRAIHGIVKEHTGASDPYREIKDRDIRIAHRLLPKIKEYVNNKQDRLYRALKASATGNSLDAAIAAKLDIESGIESELARPFAVCDIGELSRKLETAKNILIIGDNAGETVFDCVLAEELSGLDITYAVRSAPIINDATIEDAFSSGLDIHAAVVATGCEAPGMILDECDESFLDLFYHADIVISKGQGNYETLSDCDRDIFFLLKAKCPVICGLLAVGLNDYVFKYKYGE